MRAYMAWQKDGWRRMAWLVTAAVLWVLPALAWASAADPGCQDMPEAGGDMAADVALKARLLLALCRDNALAAGALSFLAGLLTSLSPCVYPLIPITISIFGARAASTRLRAFTLSASYVAGMSVLYTGLGVTFASLGLISGGLMAIPAVVIGIGLLCLAMAASMFGAFELALPAGLQTRLSQLGGSGHRGAFVMGLVAGVIAAPCTGPVLAVILGLISQSGQPGRGAVLMGFYSLGMGMLFMVLGTFSGAMARMPKSGRWMEAVKSVLGLAMLLAAIYLVKPHVGFLASAASDLGALPHAGLVGLIMLALGAAVGGIHLSFKDEGNAPKVRKGLGVVMGTLGLVTLMGWVEHVPAPAAGTQQITWLHQHDPAVAAGKAQGRPVMIDFGADWCAACKELEHVTYQDPQVSAEAQRFVTALIDSTEMTDEMTALWSRYGITGLPAVIFIDSTGKVLKDPRVEGFLQPPDFLRQMRRVH